MAQSILDRVLKDIQQLAPGELARVRDAVEGRLTDMPAADPEEQFLQSLMRAGLITEIRRPDRSSKLDRPAVPISGKPLSETVIEDRR